MGLRESKKDRTRAEILAAAEDAFRTQGFGATRVRDIAERVPVSVQTLYNYFPSKEKVLVGIIAERFGRLAGAADEMRRRFLEPEDAAGSMVDRFLHLIRWGLRALDADREFLKKGGVFSDDQIDAYIELKWEEGYNFEHTPHPVEWQMYYSA